MLASVYEDEWVEDLIKSKREADELESLSLYDVEELKAKLTTSPTNSEEYAKTKALLESIELNNNQTLELGLLKRQIGRKVVLESDDDFDSIPLSEFMTF